MERRVITDISLVNLLCYVFLSSPGKIKVADITSISGYVTEWTTPQILSLSCSTTADLSDEYQPGKIIQIARGHQ